MNEHDQVSGQGPANHNKPPRDESHIEGEAVPIPSRIRDAVNDMRQRLRDDFRLVPRETRWIAAWDLRSKPTSQAPPSETSQDAP